MAIAFLNKQEQNHEFTAKLWQQRPNDGKDGAIPGDARELLLLAHQLHTEGQKHSDEIKQREGERPEGEGHEVSSNAASPRNDHCEGVHPGQKS